MWNHLDFSNCLCVPMDFKFLPGNIYHQFESICRDVDGFVTKDTMKFVENRVQGAGMTVKRFYSNVVQDTLPVSGDIVVDVEQVDVQDHMLVTAINTRSTCISEKQVLLEQGSIDNLGDSDASFSVEFNHVTQISEPFCGDLSSGAETSLLMGERSDAIIGNGEESGVESGISRNSITVLNNSCLESLDNKVFSGVSNEDHKHSASKEVDLTTTKEETQNFNHKRGNKSNFYDPGRLSDSSRFLNSKLTLNEEWNWYSDENESLSSPSVSLGNRVNDDNSPLMDSPLPSACDANGKVPSDHFITKDDNFHVSTSVKSPPMGITPPCCCIMESSSADSIIKTENICPVHIKRDSWAVNVSTLSLVTALDETKNLDVLPSLLILKSNDNNVTGTDKSELVNASSDRHWDGYSEMLMPPSETVNVCGDFEDLSSDLKDDTKVLVLKSSCMHAASRRRNFRYYKNLIHDAFTYQKRISKEYEHLAILYGDIDMETNQFFEPNSAPLVLATYAVETQSSQKTSVTDWELI